jgi:hypothetical protein
VSCSLHDVVALEARGIPAVAIGTEPFRAEAREQAEALGMGDYEMLELPHPIQPLPIDRVVALADAVVDDVAGRLTQAHSEG